MTTLTGYHLTREDGVNIYTVGISDGMSWNAGGQTTITADSLDAAKAAAEAWADKGDYPVMPPVTVTLVARDADGEIIERWQHRVPDDACSEAR